jgi:Flp pilus assembly protein TadG
MMDLNKRSMGLRNRQGSHGSTLIEFALVVMVLMTLMLGVFEFSRLLYAYHFVGSAARRTARWAAVNGSTCANDTSSSDTGGSCNGTDGMSNGYATPTDIQNYATSLAPTGVNSANITATASWPLSGQAYPSSSICTSNPSAAGCNCYSATIGGSSSDANSPGCTVEVTLNYNFKFIFPFVHVGAITLSSTSESIITH